MKYKDNNKNKLDDVRNIWLSGDLEPDELEDNLKLVRDWEIGLLQNGLLKNWQEHDLSKQLVSNLKVTYISNAVLLGTNRELSEKVRLDLWAKQSGIKWLLSLITEDANMAIENINSQIEQAIISEDL